MGVREVTRNTSEVFDRTSKGETVIVTNRGRVVGIIIPPQAYSPQLTELIATGAVLPPALSSLPTGPRRLEDRFGLLPTSNFPGQAMPHWPLSTRE